MGNCCMNKKASRAWADEYDEEWFSYESVSHISNMDNHKETKEKEREKEKEESGRVVRIKIKKKELAKVLSSRGGAAGFTVEDLLNELISMNSREQGHWRPNLKSIPEVAEKQ